MRPTKLTLEAFGTFADRVEVDFARLSERGVFLISGETGSGKSTVFDAVCYALYGKANGRDREPKDFRSQFAKPTQDTYVELEFECNGERYVVHRSPKYSKQRVLGGGETRYVEKASEVYLLVPHGEPIKKDGNVSKAVESLVGMDCEQFRQTVMLAQGEFRRFLLADSDDKGKILNTLFGTQRYGAFVEELRHQRDLRRAEYLELLGTLVSDTLSIGYDADWEYAEEFERWKALPAESRSVEAVLPRLESYVASLSEERRLLEGTLESLSARVDRLSEEYSEHVSTNRTIESRNRLMDSLRTLRSQRGEVDAAREALQRMDVARSVEPSYSAYSQSVERVRLLRERREAIEGDARRCDGAVSELERRKLEVSERVPQPVRSLTELYAELQALVRGLESERSAVESRGVGVRGVLDSVASYCERRSRLEVRRRSLADRVDRRARLECEYAEAERLYGMDVAGVLAERLVEGEPCPVCGSLHHPDVAVRLREAPSEGRLKALRQELDDYRSECVDFQTGFLLEEERCNALLDSTLRSASEYVDVDGGVESVRARLQTVRDSLAKEYRRLDGSLSAYRQDAETVKSLDESLTQHRDRRIALSASLESASAALDAAVSERDASEASYRESLRANGLDEGELLSLLERYRDYDALKGRVDEYDRSVLDHTSRIDEYDRTVGDRTLVDTSALADELSRTRRRQRDCLERLSIVTHTLDTDSAVYRRVSSSVEPLNERYQRYMDTEYLAKAASGTLNGTERKVAFDHYAQAYYFEKVILSANRKLDVMSDGRYSLVRTGRSRSKKVRGGLDVEVFDAYTGMARAASTLSGGETFMASLALALGLSEVVQQQSGGVRVDATFIDEGFGTLDSSQTLQQAIKVIDGLATETRMVGIVSHVSELQEHFTNRLVVKKSRSGSTVEYGY